MSSRASSRHLSRSKWQVMACEGSHGASSHRNQQEPSEALGNTLHASTDEVDNSPERQVLCIHAKFGTVAQEVVAACVWTKQPHRRATLAQRSDEMPAAQGRVHPLGGCMHSSSQSMHKCCVLPCRFKRSRRNLRWRAATRDQRGSSMRGAKGHFLIVSENTAVCLETSQKRAQVRGNTSLLMSSVWPHMRTRKRSVVIKQRAVQHPLIPRMTNHPKESHNRSSRVSL